MEIVGERVLLKDFDISDLQDHIAWQTTDTEWMCWDSPWRAPTDRISPQEYAENRLARLKLISDEDIRWTFELYTNPERKHIGWMNCYCIDRFGNYAKHDSGRYALGIDIVPPEERGKGYGAEAYELFEGYLLDFGITEFYTQTWSGNERMKRLAQKLGYEEFWRRKKKFIVHGKKYDLITFIKNMV